MNTQRITPLALLLAGLATLAHGATCTVQPGGLRSVNHVPSAGDFLASVSAADDLVIPVDVDPSAGTIVVHAENLPELEFGSQGGPVKLQLVDPPVAGRIDAAGNVALAPWGISSVFAGIDLPVTPSFTTGPKSASLPGGREFPSSGVPLDFATGILTLDGSDVIQNAPIVNEPVASIFKLTCRLDPVPDRTALPAAPVLQAVKGKGKVTGADGGDTLQFTARLVPGATAVTLDGNDLVIRVADTGGTDVLFVLVRASVIPTKGKKRVVKDSDGTRLAALAGRKGSGDAAARTSGTLKLVPGKKGVAVSLRLSGLDLTPLAGPLGVTVALGDVTATTTVAAQGGGKVRKLR